MTGRPLRILCFPGFRTNAEILRRQLRGFLPDIEGVVLAFEPIPHTHPASGPPDVMIREFFPDEEYGEWWARDENEQYIGIDETVERVTAMLADAPQKYDGVLGFSQGAVLAALLARLATLPEGHPRYDARLVGAFRFAVLFAGFVPRDDVAGKLFREELPPVALPSLHVWGSADPLSAASSGLSTKFCQKQVLLHLHTAGHVVPRLGKGDGEQYERVCGFFKQFVEEGVASL
eukprot:Rhum_TRINITY_DN15928_c0_g1::Rhum_TRINITY_DN15928_c0_g1_i1::g.162490::m.162490